jgi:hypothetical protein
MLINKVNRWIKSANGWKRLWLVLSLALLVYNMVVVPIKLVHWPNDYNEVVGAIKNPICRPYLTERIENLSEPDSANLDGICILLYRHREIYVEDLSSYSLDLYIKETRQKYLLGFIMASTFGLILSIFLSAAIYFLGLICNWIRIGFANGKD